MHMKNREDDQERQVQLSAMNLTIGLFAFLLPWIGFAVPRSAALLVPLAAIILLAGSVWREQSLSTYRSSAWWTVMLFLAIATVSLLWSVNPDGAWSRIEKLVLFLPIGISLVLFSQTGLHHISQFRLIVRLPLVAGASLAVALLWFHVFTDGGVFGLLNPNYDVEEKLTSANRPSVILLLCLSAIALSLRALDLKLVLPAYILALAAGLIFSTSQTASVGLLVWLLAYGVAKWRGDVAYWGVAFGGATIIISMPALVLLVEMIDFERSFDYGAGSVGARLDIWYAVTHKILESPIWGYGLEASRVIKEWDVEFVYYGADIPHPHNGPLQVWLEFGFVGAALAAFAWVAIVRRVRQFNSGVRPELYAGLTSFLFIVSVSHGLWQSWWVNAVFGVAALTILVARGSEAEDASQV